MSGSNFDRFLDRVHGDCANASDAVYNLNGEAEKLAAEEREALLECFAMRAPKCPKWFMPVNPLKCTGDELSRRRMYRLASWPWVWAEAAIAARGGAK